MPLFICVNSIVCIKQVPNTSEVKINPDGTLKRDGVPSIMNPDDKAGLEFALQLKDKYGGDTLVHITYGSFDDYPQMFELEMLMREKIYNGLISGEYSVSEDSSWKKRLIIVDKEGNVIGINTIKITAKLQYISKIAVIILKIRDKKPLIQWDWAYDNSMP